MSVIPDTTTLAEAREIICRSPAWDTLLGATISPYTMSVKFLSHPSDEELPDAMLMWRFRLLCRVGMAKLSLSDGSGGTPVAAPEPELV